MLTVWRNWGFNCSERGNRGGALIAQNGNHNYGYGNLRD